MNVQRIDSAKSTPAFGTLKPGIKMSAETFDKLINIPVVSNFSKNFDGDVYVGSFIGRKSGKPQYSLDIRNVVPRGFLVWRKTWHGCFKNSCQNFWRVSKLFKQKI